MVAKKACSTAEKMDRKWVAKKAVHSDVPSVRQMAEMLVATKVGMWVKKMAAMSAAWSAVSWDSTMAVLKAVKMGMPWAGPWVALKVVPKVESSADS